MDLKQLVGVPANSGGHIGWERQPSVLLVLNAFVFSEGSSFVSVNRPSKLIWLFLVIGSFTLFSGCFRL